MSEKSGSDYPMPPGIVSNPTTFPVVPTYPNAPGSKPFAVPKTPPIKTGDGIIIPGPKE